MENNKVVDKLTTASKWLAASTVALSTTTQSLLQKYTPDVLKIYLTQREEAINLMPESRAAITTVLNESLSANYETCQKIINYFNPQDGNVGFAVRGMDEVIMLIQSLRENLSALPESAKDSICRDFGQLLELKSLNEMIPEISAHLNAGYQLATTELRMVGLVALLHANYSDKLITKLQKSDSKKDFVVAKLGTSAITLLTAFVMNRITEWAITGGIANESLMADATAGTIGLIAIAGSGMIADKVSHGNKTIVKAVEFMATLGVIYTKSELASTIINPLLTLIAL